LLPLISLDGHELIILSWTEGVISEPVDNLIVQRWHVDAIDWLKGRSSSDGSS
jgi:hypothetical protein